MGISNDKIVRVQVEPAFSEVIQGQSEIHGDLQITEDGLLFSYRTKNFFGKFSDEQNRIVPYDELANVELKQNIASSKIRLHFRKLGSMIKMPGEHKAYMQLKVLRSDRQKVGAFVDRLESLVSREAGTSIPFVLSSSEMGLTEHEGLLYLEDEFIVIDVKSGFAGNRKDDQHTIKIAPRAIKDIQLKTGTVHDHVLIWPRKDTLLEAMPGNHEAGRVKLKVKRKYREKLEELLMDISYD